MRTPRCTSNPRFFGYINGSGNQAAVLGELLAAAVNQICAKWQFSQAASEVERRVIQWLAQFIGYGPDAGGCLLNGGSAGNFAGLAVARQQKAPFDADLSGRWGGPPLTVYMSREGHASVDKSMALLGMGRAQLRKIAVLDDFTIDLEGLREQVAADRANGYHPICVVGNAGTINTGAVDPLAALAEFCRTQGLWFHVDAAYGGPAALTSAAGPLFDGLAEADSVVVNAHKWLYVPVEASCILVRQPSALRDTFRIVADYLQGETDETSDGPIDFKDYGPQLSRSFRALKVWMTFKAYGARKLRAAIESNIAVMRYSGGSNRRLIGLRAPCPGAFVGGVFSVPHLGCVPSRRSDRPGQVERRAGGRAGARRPCVSLRDEDSREDGAPGVHRQSSAATVRRGLLIRSHPRRRRKDAITAVRVDPQRMQRLADSAYSLCCSRQSMRCCVGAPERGNRHLVPQDPFRHRRAE